MSKKFTQYSVLTLMTIGMMSMLAAAIEFTYFQSKPIEQLTAAQIKASLVAFNWLLLGGGGLMMMGIIITATSNKSKS